MHQEYHQEMTMASALFPERWKLAAANVDEQCSVIIHHPDPAAVKHLDIPSAIPNTIATIQVKVYCQQVLFRLLFTHINSNVYCMS